MHPARTLCLASLSFLAAVPPALAEEPYLDDRSTPAALIHSLYNAVNRHEYARAFSYFSEPPAKDVDTYAKGYEKTDHVKIVTGEPGSEGAAGSTYYDLPVAIEAVGTDGNSKIFAGCYTLRLANPQIQGAPYNPLHIEKGSLKSASGELADVLPKKCGDGPTPPPSDVLLEKAKAVFAAAYAGTCTSLEPGADPGSGPDSWEIPFQYTSDPKDTLERKARLFRFFCSSGAYNAMDVYYFADDQGGLRNLQFAEPELDIRYEGGKTEGDKVESIDIIGYTVRDQLVNSNYDPDRKAITEVNKWRGVGDASSSGTWIFRNGTFTLVKYDVDASYDGEENPKTILDYDTGP